MNDLEAKIRCLELSASLLKPLGDYSAENVVDMAKKLYDSCNESQVERPIQEIVSKADKVVRRGRPPKR